MDLPQATQLLSGESGFQPRPSNSRAQTLNALLPDWNLSASIFQKVFFETYGAMIK